VGLATDVPITFLTVGGFSFTQALLDTTTYLASAPDPPSVMTTSYGAPEDTFAPSDAQYVLLITESPRHKPLSSTGKSVPDTWRSVRAGSRSSLPLEMAACAATMMTCPNAQTIRSIPSSPRLALMVRVWLS
jgi:hypothetical protein